MRGIAACATAKLMFAALLFSAVMGVGGFVAAPVQADDAMEARHLAEKARLTLEIFSKAPEMEGFRNLVKNARGVFIAPQIIKGAFIIGASGGSGVFMARDYKTGQWAGPAFYTIGEASFGFQAGGSASEVVLLAMTDRGIYALLESSVKLGADVGVAAGPVGIGAAAATANLSADIVTFARSKGLYGGISVDGAIVKTRNDWNSAFYGTSVTPSEILIRRTVSSQASAGLIQEVSRLTGANR